MWGADRAIWGAGVAVLVTVSLCEVARWVSRRMVRSGPVLDVALEVISTLQLCSCVREQVQLGRSGALDTPGLGPALTFLLTLLHGATARGATCNPSGALERFLRGEESGPRSILRVIAQFTGASLSARSPKPCPTPLNLSLLPGAALESICSLGMFSLNRHLDRSRHRTGTTALGVTGIVLLGGRFTGAVFNPALAYAILFHCEGNTFLEYVIVYWVGPLAGAALSVLIYDQTFPVLKGKTHKEQISNGAVKMNKKQS